MANTTSGTVTFDKTFSVDEIINEAYERIGSQVTSGYQLKTATHTVRIVGYVLNSTNNSVLFQPDHNFILL